MCTNNLSEKHVILPLKSPFDCCSLVSDPQSHTHKEICFLKFVFVAGPEGLKGPGEVQVKRRTKFGIQFLRVVIQGYFSLLRHEILSCGKGVSVPSASDLTIIMNSMARIWTQLCVIFTAKCQDNDKVNLEATVHFTAQR